MSHFYVIAIVPGSVEDVEGYIEEKMERYSENRMVDSYDHECECIGLDAEIDARKEADKKFGSLSDLRESYRPIRKKVLEDMGVDPKIGMYDEGWTDEADKAIDKSWKDHIKPYEDFVEEVKRNHPMNGKPGTKCDTCHGAGVYKSTYNPESQWDWYRIGGRWDGVICHTYVESTDNGFNFGANHESVEKNMIAASKFLDAFTEENVPYAIIDPDGEWHQKGKMGWWGISTGESDTWKTDAHEILKKYRCDHVFVGLDCHI